MTRSTVSCSTPRNGSAASRRRRGRQCTAAWAYRLVSKDSAKARWLKDVPADKQADLIPPGVFEAWANATWATDPESSKQNPPMLRAPNGVPRTA